MSAKGTTWEKTIHKYVKKVNKRYYYKNILSDESLNKNIEEFEKRLEPKSKKKFNFKIPDVKISKSSMDKAVNTFTDAYNKYMKFSSRLGKEINELIRKT